MNEFQTVCTNVNKSVFTLMYSGEHWFWMKMHKGRLTAVDVCGYSQKDHVRNKERIIGKPHVKRVSCLLKSTKCQIIRVW